MPFISSTFYLIFNLLKAIIYLKTLEVHFYETL
nr:MAG TPA: hypothetical protein [Caudoviricetes sp.]